MSMTIDQMRGKLLEWNPSWNVDKFTDEQIVVIYNKERSAIVNSIFDSYTKS
jgi:hypothetical protein